MGEIPPLHSGDGSAVGRIDVGVSVLGFRHHELHRKADRDVRVRDRRSHAVAAADGHSRRIGELSFAEHRRKNKDVHHIFDSVFDCADRLQFSHPDHQQCHGRIYEYRYLQIYNCSGGDHGAGTDAFCGVRLQRTSSHVAGLRIQDGHVAGLRRRLEKQGLVDQDRFGVCRISRRRQRRVAELDIHLRHSGYGDLFFPGDHYGERVVRRDGALSVFAFQNGQQKIAVVPQLFQYIVGCVHDGVVQSAAVVFPVYIHQYGNQQSFDGLQSGHGGGSEGFHTISIGASSRFHSRGGRNDCFARLSTKAWGLRWITTCCTIL